MKNLKKKKQICETFEKETRNFQFSFVLNEVSIEARIYKVQFGMGVKRKYSITLLIAMCNLICLCTHKAIFALQQLTHKREAISLCSFDKNLPRIKLISYSFYGII